MTLTPRQREVARLVTMGRSNKQIAASLGISERRVEQLLAAVVVKWEIRASRVAALIARRYTATYGADDLVA